MSFSPDWLALREPFDHAARAASLATGLRSALDPGAAEWHLLELGGGTGSGVRWLAPRLGRPARFTVLDHDPELLQRVDPALATTRVADVRDLDAWPDRVDAVTLQALLDLVDLDFLVGLADAVTDRGIPLLAALTVDGRVRWSPPHPDDEAVQAAFRVHQLGDRGFGGSVGPFAAPILADLLRCRGYEVELVRADWHIPASATAMLAAMVDGAAQAAGEVGTRGVDVAAWAAWRHARLGPLTVGHLDLLGRPARR